MKKERMRARRLMPFALFVLAGAAAQGGPNPGDAPQWTFDFSGGVGGNGVIAVAPGRSYDIRGGYGFEKDATVRRIVRSRRAGGGFVTADTPFRFSVILPEGDYRVRVRFGDADGTSDTTVKAEARRLMLEKVATRRGQTTTREFLVDVRSTALPAPPATAPGGDRIRINPREVGSASWDEKLTLTFSGAAPKISGLTIERVEVPRLFLMGDSTVTDQTAEPYAAWGQMLPRFFAPDIAVANYAESGETLKSSLTSLRLDKVLSEIRPGDWVFIQFGHNDEKLWPQTHADAATTYQTYLRAYIAEFRRMGASPVLVTPMPRRNFAADGHLIDTHGAYLTAMRHVAETEKVPLIDLNRLATTLFETMGPEESPHAFARDGEDKTHQNDYGAYELARCVVEGIRALALPLGDHLRADVSAFDPRHPDARKDFDFLKAEPGS